MTVMTATPPHTHTTSHASSNGSSLRRTSRWWSVPILTYHRVGEPQRDHVPTVTPEAFLTQLRTIHQRWRVVDVGEIVERFMHGEPIDRRAVAVTFDDGYAETSTIAAPILHEQRCPATVFVTPKEIGQPGFMSWDQVRDLHRFGVSVGSHTMHHTYLPLVTNEQARLEVLESKQMLDQQLGRPIRWLSYPIGGYTPDIQEFAIAAGYEAAFTTNRGFSKRSDDLFALRRIKVTERDRHPLLLRVKLSGYYDVFRRLERPA